MRRRSPPKKRPSTRDLDALPPPPDLARISRAIALLDAILEPSGELRFFSFDPRWGAGESLASMRSGEGDFYFIWFSPRGVVIRGFDHEAPMSPFRREDESPWPGLFHGLPDELHYALEEPAFAQDEVTFCIWRRAGDDRWRAGSLAPPPGPDPDGSARLLWMLDGEPETYVRFAAEYHERTIDRADVARVYAGGPIDPELILSLNPKAKVSQVMKSAGAMGMKTSAKAGKPAAKKAAVRPKRAPVDDDDDLLGEAEFKVIAVGGSVKMVVGGKVAAEVEDPDLYDAIFEMVASAIKKPSKK